MSARLDPATLIPVLPPLADWGRIINAELHLEAGCTCDKWGHPCPSCKKAKVAKRQTGLPVRSKIHRVRRRTKAAWRGELGQKI